VEEKKLIAFFRLFVVFPRRNAMDNYQRSLRTGAAAIACALILRFALGGWLQPVTNWLLQPQVQSFLIYLETGRIVRFSPSLEQTSNSDGESAPPQLQHPQTLPTFSPEDGANAGIKYGCAHRPDLSRLLTQPLSWDLTGSEPTVLIIHTHTTESYTPAPGEDYKETSPFRTLDPNYNMLSVGDALAEALTQAGITVIHDREFYDYPAYNGSYARARASIGDWQTRYPSIVMVLDLHRDASGDLNNQLKTSVTVDGVTYAGLMLVVGTDASGLKHPDWEENLALGLKLQVLLEDALPGITRPISLRAQRFNQDMTPGSLIVEVGAAGDSHSDALRSMEILAQAIIRLSKGSA
jgi:stage II sporulation protein P